MKTKAIKLSALNQDDEILELRSVNPVTVSRYRQAMRTGAKFPPLVVTPDNLIVSGNHRYESAIAELGESHAIDCIVKTFPDRAAMIEEAARENATHGEAMDGFSRRKFALRLIQLGRTPEAIAQIFNVPVKRIEEWGGQTVVIRGKGHVPTKRGLEHISGKTVSNAQYQEHSRHDKGVPAASMARQLASWLRNGWVNFDDPKTAQAIEDLSTEIENIKTVA